MRRFFKVAGSLKITVVLLLVMLVVLSVGTIVESMHGREAAAKVYGSPAFYALLAAFALNLFASIVDKWPWGRFRIGFLMTHLSMLVILIGALTTLFFKVEGRLALWEGQSSDTIMTGGGGQKSASVDLGFSLRLDSFEIDVYPGTQRPAMFRSRVTVIDPSTGAESRHIIEMNRELSSGGFTFFQSSYQVEGGRRMSILSVSRDPGQNIVFLGYTLLVLGMLVVLATRLRQRRNAQPKPSMGSGSLPTMALVVLALCVGSSGAEAQDAAAVDTLRHLPVQHDGRVMPLDTLARESVWKVTGKRSWVRQDPVKTVMGWVLEPSRASGASMVRIGSKTLASEIGLPGRRFASFNDLLMTPHFRTLIDDARRKAARELRLSSVEEDALELEGRLGVLHSFLTNQAILAIPVDDDPAARWAAPDKLSSAADFIALGEQLASNPAAVYPSAQTIRREVSYNRIRPTRLAWLLLLPASVCAYLSWRRNERWSELSTAVGLFAGFAVMTWGIGMRWFAAGRIPASNMYESMLFLAWGVGLFAAFATIWPRNRLVIFNAAAMSTLVMVLTDVLPMDSFIHPMPPVLSGTPWLAIHVPIIMVSYALLALSAFVAHMRVGLEIFKPDLREHAETLDEAHYWYVHIGSILLLVGILTGSIWAASSWGRYWGWDPKEVWSLVAFLAYMAILHARIDRWLGAFGVAAASILAFGTILMTYLGVNYVLAAGLHSYGFGGSKIAMWLVIGGIVETVFVSVGFFAYRRNARQAELVALDNPS